MKCDTYIIASTPSRNGTMATAREGTHAAVVDVQVEMGNVKVAGADDGLASLERLGGSRTDTG